MFVSGGHAASLRAAKQRFLVFCDDLSFEAEDTSYKSLKAVLEGGIEGRPDNVLLYATSNRRHLMAREMLENDTHTNIAEIAAENSIDGVLTGAASLNAANFTTIVRAFARPR